MMCGSPGVAYRFPYQEVIDTVIGGYGQQSYGMFRQDCGLE